MCQEWWYLTGTQKKAQEIWLSSDKAEILEGKSAIKPADSNITNVVGRKRKSREPWEEGVVLG